MKRYGKTWKPFDGTKEDMLAIDCIWQVMKLPKEILWEENGLGRLFLEEKDGTIWQTDF